MRATVDERLARTFVELADTLVAGYDLIEFLKTLAERCMQLLAVDAVGLLLADAGGTLQLVAASTEQAGIVELFQVQNDEGPCLDCCRTGQPVIMSDIRADQATARWPRFAAAVLEAGFAGLRAIPSSASLRDSASALAKTRRKVRSHGGRICPVHGSRRPSGWPASPGAAGRPVRDRGRLARALSRCPACRAACCTR
jgi:hypothetical protein